MTPSESKPCESKHTFQSTMGKHELDGKEFHCESEAGHKHNHTAKSGRTYKDKAGIEQPELVHWV